MREQIKLEAMIQDLLALDDEVWGLYAFSRDILNKRVPQDRKKQMIGEAISCGKKYAKHLAEEYGAENVKFICEKLNLKIELKDNLMTGKRILFASYTPPDKIEIMQEPVIKAVQLISQEAPNMLELFNQDGIMNTILGHEIFHFLEEHFEKEIYTRTEKILLWKFIGIKNYSTIRALGEIGAMAFTRELNKLKYSPFILDILLFYAYDAASACKIYRNVLEMSSGRCREIVDDY